MDTTTSPQATQPRHLGSRRSVTRTFARTGIAGLAAAAVLGTFGVGYASAAAITSAPPSTNGTTAVADPWTNPYGDQSGTGTPSTETTSATAAQKVGLVYITTTLDYGSGQAAGTGMVLTSDGEVLTNHHVVEGATAISVEIASTGATYEAEVVGYDATSDVALLQLEDASGLRTVTTDTDEPVQVGDAVVGVGNAGGTSEASAAAGTVTALEQAITVSDESGGSEHLTNLIEINADIVSGDSGGPLYDDDGEVVGMDTASSGSADVTAYAIPIATALRIVHQISSGQESGTVQIGATAFLGVTLANTASAVLPGEQYGSDGTYGYGYGYGYGYELPQQQSALSGVVIAGTVEGSAAADAGVTAGDIITALDGTATTSADALSETIASHDAGDRVSIAWTDTAGQSHTATVTLGEGPVG
ncbi:S1C family serine protease [Mumia sp. DW29H23]|uniref:S1C family serine protease n=1 Tax=Mumia sp. DW29H23 TaxID=3421241 RepID=UPI003D684360